MKHEYRFSWLEGEEVSVRAPLESHYRSIVDEIEPEGDSKEDRFLAHMQVVVWGALFIEATTNYAYEQTLRHVLGYHSDNFEPIWNLTKRSHIRDKIEAISELLKLDEEEYEQNRKAIARLNDLRNRLVHYKESPTEVDLSPEEALRQDPDPKIVDDILAADFEDRKDEILQTGDWIESAARDAITDN